MQALLRFLDLVRRELGADDVRGELGGREPTGDVVWASMPSGIRVVVVFDTPPADLDDKRSKLRTLLESFASLGAIDEPSHPPPPRGVGHDLDDALDVLAQRARAGAAFVIDDTSPVIWGSSLVPHGPEDVDEAIWIARVARAVRNAGHDLSEIVTRDPESIRSLLSEGGVAVGDVAALARDVERVRELGTRALDRVHLLSMRAVAAVREHEGKEGTIDEPELLVFVRHFATIYRLVLVFDSPFSELHAEGALIHALPVIERLVTSLPPRDPAAGGAKVAVLRRLRRV
jgi:hypothetical protein